MMPTCHEERKLNNYNNNPKHINRKENKLNTLTHKQEVKEHDYVDKLTKNQLNLIGRLAS